ncbi:cytidylyltransferase domain-containing protein [Leptospira sp. GIMC2001]|uniref:cytidylyltransferase domain-containing protein n=1 Tax=Leptospira sp. GIMC2001 TaxID=1513297 RepID=UPI00234B71A6|nr:hypothetical protein [Leptospira sp. GIMC2001]WCL49654.1 hypothetical protein O4O04_02210 [Leptospira sp. GIMC2001]
MSGIPSTDNCFAFVQARIGSSRLTGKVLKNLPNPNGPNLLEHIHSRLIKILPEDRIVFLIPETDKQLEEFLIGRKFNYFLGPLDDVRARFRLAAEKYSADIIFRLTGDNPFVDIRAMELILEAWNYSFVHNKQALDLVSCTPLPLGMGIESFSVSALMSGEDCNEERHKEHVSLHIKEKPNLYNIIRIPTGMSSVVNGIRCTIDEPADFEMMEAICKSIAPTSILTNQSNQENSNNNQLAQLKSLDARYEESFQSNSMKVSFSDPYQQITAETVLNLYNNNPEIFAINQKVDQVRFPLPPPITKRKEQILIIAGNPKQFGYGHWERMSILAAQLAVEGFNLTMTDIEPESNSTLEKYDIVIFDKRDIDITNRMQCPVLYIDSNRSNRSKYPESHIDILPNTIHSGNLDDFNILISSYVNHTPYFNSLKKKKKWELLIYAGNLDYNSSTILDRSVVELFPPEHIYRIGGMDTGLVPWKARVTKSEWWLLLRSTKKFLSYFGQGVMEAIALDLEVATYSISKTHRELSLLLDREASIPWLGDVVAYDFDSPYDQDLSNGSNSANEKNTSSNILDSIENDKYSRKFELRFSKSSKQFTNTAISEILIWIDKEMKRSRIGL